MSLCYYRRVSIDAIFVSHHRSTSLSLTTKSSNTHPSPGNGVSCLLPASCSRVQSKRGSMPNDSISDARIINLESAEVKRWMISDTYRCCLFNAGLRFRYVYSYYFFPHACNYRHSSTIEMFLCHSHDHQKGFSLFPLIRASQSWAS